MTSAAEYVQCRRNLLEIFDEQIERSQPDTTTDRLTGFTRDHYYHIKTYANFAAVEEQFLGAIDKFRVCSFDSESRRLSTDLWGGLESYLIGTYDGSVYDFSIPDLKRQAEEDCSLIPGKLSSILPSVVVRVLESRKVLKLGSDAGADSFDDEELGINTSPVVCTQILHQLADGMSPTREFATGHGLGRVAADIYYYTHKPKVGKFEQPAAWRKHANFHLYDWSKPLKNYAFVYRALDAALPLCLLSWILRAYLREHAISKALVCGPLFKLLHTVAQPALAIGTGVWTKGSVKNPSRWKPRTNRKGTGTITEILESEAAEETRFTREKEAEDAEAQISQREDREIIEVEIVEESESEDEMIVDAIGEVGVVEEKQKNYPVVVFSKSVPNGGGITSLDLQSTQEELAELENGAKDPLSGFLSKKRKMIRGAQNLLGFTGAPGGKRVKLGGAQRLSGRTGTSMGGGAQKKRRRARESVFVRMTAKMRAENKFKFKPALTRWCGYCSRTTHSKRDSKNVPMCPAFRRQLRNLVTQVPATEECLYKLCENKIGHRTAVCPYMSERCSKCWLRGHAAGKCPDESQRDGYKSMFEEYADESPLLSQRHHDPNWGFYYIKKSQSCMMKYDELVEMSVKDAMNAIQKM